MAALVKFALERIGSCSCGVSSSVPSIVFEMVDWWETNRSTDDSGG